jgi:hypothetical protein
VVVTTCIHVYLLRAFCHKDHVPTCQHMSNQNSHQLQGIIHFFKQVTMTTPATQASHQKSAKPSTPWCYSAPARPPKRSIIKAELFRKRARTSRLSLPKKQASVYLQEVLARAPPTRWHCTSVIWHRAEDFEVRLQILAERHDRRHVAAAVAVVRR